MNVEVTVSPQFDLCFALADLASPNPHFAGWPGVDEALIADARSFGWVFWLGLPDLVELDRPARTSAEFIGAIAAIAPKDIVPRLHKALVQQPTGRFASAQSRQWLHFIGFDSGAPDPSWAARWEEPMDPPLAVLKAFRPHFDRVWKALSPELKASAAHASEVARDCQLAPLASKLDLGVEFDERGEIMRTPRGYKLPLADVGSIFILPSVFNSRRFKTVTEYSPTRSLYIPYLLEDVELPDGLRRTADFGIDIDPWLVCRALGNDTRAAILQLIADRPRAAFEIQQELELSKANVSHHIFQLREAGLITERRMGRTVELGIHLQSLRGLSRALTRELGRRRSA
ncbi:ArsR/SmtB family transcription factor [Sphingomonas sp. URHD0057]|uniref:ArsR/SmtB family transcription factor n=1 Tax=Sphingomonas sp. URHD0057 TaxID=1380389 RepID=UPI0006866E87|nr:winged helix-turn-helix domain-containing protein [Sphingomonas sp. URHD0057]